MSRVCFLGEIDILWHLLMLVLRRTNYDEVWVALNWQMRLPTPKTHPDFPLWRLGYTPEQVYDLIFPKSMSKPTRTPVELNSPLTLGHQISASSATQPDHQYAADSAWKATGCGALNSWCRKAKIRRRWRRGKRSPKS